MSTYLWGKSSSLLLKLTDLDIQMSKSCICERCGDVKMYFPQLPFERNIDWFATGDAVRRQLCWKLALDCSETKTWKWKVEKCSFVIVILNTCDALCWFLPLQSEQYFQKSQPTKLQTSKHWVDFDMTHKNYMKLWTNVGGMKFYLCSGQAG